MQWLFKAVTIIQENNYYAFGMEMDLRTHNQVGVENPYQYNGKELNEDLGLNLSDYGARWYDAAIARFTTIDPLAEAQHSSAIYHYAANNPMRFIDYMGLAASDPEGVRKERAAKREARDAEEDKEVSTRQEQSREESGTESKENRPLPVDNKYKNKDFRVDSWFGPRNVKNNKNASKFHKGLDINFGSGYFDFGADVCATHDGTVTIDDNNEGKEGRSVTITSKDGKFRTQYFHLSKITVKNGDFVNESDFVGNIGASALGSENGTDCHLHYQIQVFNNQTKKFEMFNPTQGRGNKISNIVDPQQWIQKTVNSSVNTNWFSNLFSTIKSNFLILKPFVTF